MTASSEQSRPARERQSAWQRWELGSLAETAPLAAAPVDAAREAEAAALANAVEEGRAHGYRDGRAAADAETLRLCSIVDALETAVAHDVQALADEVLDLALMLARRMAGESLAVRRELLLPIVEAALRQLPHATQRVQIALNPADVELVRGHLDPVPGAAQYELAARPSIEPGGCIVESEACEVDASFGARWARLVAAMGRSDDWIDHP